MEKEKEAKIDQKTLNEGILFAKNVNHLVYAPLSVL